MSYVTALLPVAAGVSVYAALKHAADTNSDGRSRGQVMADTLVAQVTRRAPGAAAPVAVNLVLTDDSLFGDGDAPARLAGYGPIPAGVARALIAAAGTEGAATLRRLYAHPASGALVAMESRARCFPRPGWPASSPPAMTPAALPTAMPRSATSITSTRRPARDDLRGQRGRAVRGLQLHQRGPRSTRAAEHDENGVHAIKLSTPTGARHRTKAPPLPGSPRIDISRTEWLLSTHLGNNAA